MCGDDVRLSSPYVYFTHFGMCLLNLSYVVVFIYIIFDLNVVYERICDISSYVVSLFYSENRLKLFYFVVVSREKTSRSSSP